MAKSFEQYQRRRLISSYFSVVFSIFLVLFLLGALGLFVINSEKISNDFKENIPMSVYFKDEANDTILNNFDTSLKNAKYIKTYDFVTKEEAAIKNPDIVGKDFMEFLGFNPLQNSFDIHLKSDYVNKSEITKIEQEFKQNPNVSDVIYDKELVEMVNENVAKISFYILIVSAILALIAILLINSSIRISIYAHRFTIKTMQMVGATKAFIRKPFVKTSVILGIIGAVLAIITLFLVGLYINSLFPTLKITEDFMSFGIVSVGILIVGILITSLSTVLATNRFLNLNTDDLY
jgi:cell division transport system permease protein